MWWVPWAGTPGSVGQQCPALPAPGWSLHRGDMSCSPQVPPPTDIGGLIPSLGVRREGVPGGTP